MFNTLRSIIADQLVYLALCVYPEGHERQGLYDFMIMYFKDKKEI